MKSLVRDAFHGERFVVPRDEEPEEWLMPREGLST